MKRIFAIFLTADMVMCVVLTFSGCDKQIFDTTYNFKTAIISLPNGEIIEGKVDSWKDFEDGDQIQVKINGITYLVHSSNICLMTE